MPAAASARPSAAKAPNSIIVKRGWMTSFPSISAKRNRTAQRLIGVHIPDLRADGIQQQLGSPALPIASVR